MDAGEAEDRMLAAFDDALHHRATQEQVIADLIERVAKLEQIIAQLMAPALPQPEAA